MGTEALALAPSTYGAAVATTLKRLACIQLVEVADEFAFDIPRQQPEVYLDDETAYLVVTVLKGVTGTRLVVYPQDNVSQETLLAAVRTELNKRHAVVKIGSFDSRNATGQLNVAPPKIATQPKKRKKKRRREEVPVRKVTRSAKTARRGKRSAATPLREGSHPAVLYSHLIGQGPKTATTFEVNFKGMAVDGLNKQQVWNAVTLLIKHGLLSHGSGRGVYVVHRQTTTAKPATKQHALVKQPANTLTAITVARPSGDGYPVVDDLRAFARNMLFVQRLIAQGFRAEEHRDGTIAIIVPPLKLRVR